jgi:hypothetical protein
VQFVDPRKISIEQLLLLVDRSCPYAKMYVVLPKQGINASLSVDVALKSIKNTDEFAEFENPGTFAIDEACTPSLVL